jgi:hypothetical protein
MSGSGVSGAGDGVGDGPSSAAFGVAGGGMVAAAPEVLRGRTDIVFGESFFEF